MEFSLSPGLILTSKPEKLNFSVDIDDKSPVIDTVKYNALEIIGEIAWAHWSLGNYRKAWAAMSGLVCGLEKINDFQDKQFRRLFLKMGHVLGWMARVAYFGQPPALTLSGEEYTKPFPGFFSVTRFKSDDFELPPFLYIPFYQLGLFAYGCGLFELSWRNLNKAKRLDSPDATKYSIDLILAELAARKENYSDALILSTSGVKAQVLATFIRKNLGYQGITANVSFEEIWLTISEQERPDSTRWIYWNTIGPAITKHLKEDAPISTFQSTIIQFEYIFKQHAQLIDLQFWLNIFRKLKIAFSPLATIETINEQLRTFPNEPNLRTLFFLALSLIDNVSLKWKCQIQADAFDFLTQGLPYTKLMVEYVAAYLFNFWVKTVQTSSSAFRSPELFMNYLQSLQLPLLQTVALLLLIVADEIGAHMDNDARERLMKLGS